MRPAKARLGIHPYGLYSPLEVAMTRLLLLALMFTATLTTALAQSSVQPPSRLGLGGGQPAIGTPAQPAFGTPGSAPSLAPQGGQVIAQGMGGALTTDAIAAYFEALEFVHSQLGQPMQFDAAVRQQFTQTLAANFASLPPDTQQTLAQARPLWTQYAQSWAMLPMTEKQDFAYFVLAIAYGEQTAAQALGVQQGGGGGGDGGTYGGDVYIDPNYPGSDCWASAGCSYDSGSGTYNYETYE